MDRGKGKGKGKTAAAWQHNPLPPDLIFKADPPFLISFFLVYV
jgi:hypothetical protein